MSGCVRDSSRDLISLAPTLKSCGLGHKQFFPWNDLTDEKPNRISGYAFPRRISPRLQVSNQTTNMKKGAAPESSKSWVSLSGPQRQMSTAPISLGHKFYSGCLRQLMGTRRISVFLLNLAGNLD